MHAQAIIQRAHYDAEAIRRLANPLFVQAFVTIELILDMLDVAINYFAQRRPAELGRFAWMIDRKDRTVTEMEQIWSGLLLPFGEPRSAQRPFSMVEGFDYSHFAKYKIDEPTADDRMKLHLRWMRETLPFSKAVPDELHCIDAKRIWTEERVFEDSKNSLGLQLADIAATTLCRGLNGNLQRPGWEPLARLLTARKRFPLCNSVRPPANTRIWSRMPQGSGEYLMPTASRWSSKPPSLRSDGCAKRILKRPDLPERRLGTASGASPEWRRYSQVARHRRIAGVARRSFGSPSKIQGKSQRVFQLLHCSHGKAANPAFKTHSWQRS